MSPITTHILDTSTGHPAAAVPVTLSRRTAAGDWLTLASGTTDRDGRVRDFATAPEGKHFEPGTYRLAFQTAAYFAAHKTESFYPFVEVTFEIKDPSRHYHVPLLISPFGYSTYRGS